MSKPKRTKKIADDWVDELLSLINRKGSLANICDEMMEKIIGDRRITLFEVVEPKQRQMMLRLVKDYSWENVSEEVFSESRGVELKMYKHRKFNWQSITRSNTLGFLFRITLDFTDIYTEGPVDIPFAYYVAAAYGGYTLEMVRSHVEEIEEGYYKTPLEKIEEQVEKYLSIMRTHNKSLPEDVRLWLELR